MVFYGIDTEEKVIVDNNYVCDCRDFVGPDITGEQVLVDGEYQNPQDTPIEDAGCGW